MELMPVKTGSQRMCASRRCRDLRYLSLRPPLATGLDDDETASELAATLRASTGMPLRSAFTRKSWGTVDRSDLTGEWDMINGIERDHAHLGYLPPMMPHPVRREWPSRRASP